MSGGGLRPWLDTFGVIAQMAFRNLLASRLKTVIVGGIILFGALLVVLGTSLLDSMDDSMSRSIIGSVAGHIQVYSSRSKDELEVMGSMNMTDPDLEELDDFARVRRFLLGIPHVRAVVPMGISGALVTSGNTIDVALEKLRAAVRAIAPGGAPTPDAGRRLEAEKAHIRQIVSVLQGDLKNLRTVSDERTIDTEGVAAVSRAASLEFWAGFDRDPLDALEFLENRIAPLAADSDLLFLRYVGTDLDAFAASFDRMRIVDGTAVPRGQRGFLFSKLVYEDQLKLKSARRLDEIKEALEVKRLTIAADPELQRKVRENTTQVREIVLQLDGDDTRTLRARLQGALRSTESDAGKLLAELFRTSDANFAERYRIFYADVAPLINLYRIRVGDTLTIKAFTRSGYVQSVNLRVYGTFQFQGLEKSTLAGAVSLMDLVSFRELYGFLTADREAEIRELKQASGAKAVSRENAEAELFGARTVEAESTPGLRAEAPSLEGLAGRLRREDLARRVYDPRELEEGVILNAAVILDDPEAIPITIRAIEDEGKRAGLPLKAISWQKASGLIGQFVTLMRIVLYTAVLIIFVVALVIINNALVMATLERVQEIGTLRAVGAQRRFILAMLVLEAVVVGLVFGILGAGVGAGLVALIGRVGIPATTDVMFFFFSGPRLHPFLATANLAVALAIVLVVSALSSIYPAWIAMRVNPRQAMQTEE